MANTVPVIAIVGATATGKSAVSLEVARLLEPMGGAEIVNADSMQFYRGMDIGTAKLSLAERQGIAHHQLDVLDVHQDASAARFQEDARADISRIRADGRVPVVVGGSGLYLRALLDEFEFPGTDPAVRAQLEARAEAEGPGLLHRELAALDPQAAEKISANNTKRIVRALEIHHLQGSYRSSLPRYQYALDAIQVELRLDNESLDLRIAERVDRMWAAGLPAEVQTLVQRGLRLGVTAQRAVGYAETLRHLDGELSDEETLELIKRNTRRLARRQARWFDPDPRVHRIQAPRDAEDVVRAAQEVVSLARSQPLR